MFYDEDMVFDLSKAVIDNKDSYVFNRYFAIDKYRAVSPNLCMISCFFLTWMDWSDKDYMAPCTLNKSFYMYFAITSLHICTQYFRL